MKRVFVFALSALLFANAALAEKITEDEAKAVASKFFNSNSAVRKASGNGQVLKLAGASTGYYIFNRGTASGYVIVAADDKAADKVLGYADEGTVDMRSLPENMAWWLAEYDRQMASVAQSKTSKKAKAVAKYSNIAPLITAKWDQNTPYNDLCPVLRDTLCPTGCVATAMAQIMYYHKWPEKGVGTNSYEWYGEILSADFSKSTYNWDAMTDRYDSQSAGEAKEAVASLMHDAGFSVDMEYGTKASGAYSMEVPTSLAKYFSYDKNIKFVPRAYFGVTEWDDMVYRELAASRPVYYCGSTIDGNAGHAFVCDGYRDGFFHFNWGWSGESNGYFLLTALDPDQQGIGGSSSGYSFDQAIIVNAQRPREDTVIEPFFQNRKPFSAEKDQATLSETVKFNGLFVNGGVYAATVNLGLMAINASGDTTYVAGESDTYQAASSTNNINVNMAQFPKAEGEYVVYPACQDQNTNVWYKINTRTDTIGSVIATVKGSNVTFSTPAMAEYKLTTTGLTATSPLYAGKSFTATATISNTGGEFFDVVHALFMNVGDSTYAAYTDGSLVGLPDGMSQEISFAGVTPSKAGNYELVLVDQDYYYISERVPVTVREAPTGAVEMTLTNQLALANPTNVSADNISVSATIQGVSGLFDNTITLGFFRNEEEECSDMLSQKAIIGSGDEVTVVFKGELPNAEVGDKYLAAIYYLDNQSWVRLPAIDANYNRLSFTIGTLTGINDAKSSGTAGETLVYTLSGTLVGSYKGTSTPDLNDLPKGLYVVKKGTEVKKIRN